MSRRCHEVYLSNKENIECEITYSGEPECMCCGQNLLDTDLLECEEATGWLTCNNCCSHPIGTCDCCGAEIYSEDDEFWLDDQVLCPNCYESETVTNLITGDRIWNDDTSLVDGIWNMQNSTGDQFKLLISKGGKKYTLYTLDGKVYLKGYLTTRLV